MEEMEVNPSCPVALIVGVTGMVGFSLSESLKNKPGTSQWKVYGVSRRSLPVWFPSSLLHEFISLDALDQTDTTQKLKPIAHEVTHVFWVALQLQESEETNVLLNSTMFKNVLDVIVTSKPSRLMHVTIQTGTKHYMGPIFDPSLEGQLKVIHQELPFEEGSPRLPYPNFYYALEDLVASYSDNFKVTYSIHRSSIIIGASTRSVHNVLFTLSVYATICKYKGLPFRYPGSKYTWEHFCDMADARVLAEQHIWAATSCKAKNQAFNCCNGDVFTWKGLWRVLCDVFDVGFVEVVDDKSGKFDWVEMMKDKGPVWDEIVERYGLVKTKLEEMTCFEPLGTVMNFGFQHVCSMNKSKELGFFGYADTLKGIRMWIGRLRDMKIIP